MNDPVRNPEEKSLHVDRKKLRYVLRHLWLLFSFFMLASFVAGAQNTVITGKVTDASTGQPLSGVSVQVKATTMGTSTDNEGNFSIEVTTDNVVLVFSFVGYESKEEAVNGRTHINTSLSSIATGLNEVVVVGYGTQKKSDLTGAVSVVDVEKMTEEPNGVVANQLQGRVSGVTILGSGQPGETPSIRIRGINTFGNNNPLFVVDGTPTTDISDLNPNDISSMQVLKDASASIYGSRASNGVIIITTKTGTEGKTKVTYDAFMGTQRVKRGNVWDLNSPQEMADLKWLVYSNTSPGSPINDPLYGNGSSPVLPDYIDPAGLFEGDPRVDPSLYHVDPFYTDPSELSSFYRIVRANKQGTDWYHEIMKDAPIMSHNLSVSGGSNAAKYFLSMGYFNQKGTLIETYLKRYSVRANSQFKIKNHIRIGENLEYSITDNPQITALSEGSAIGMARRMQPIIPVYDIMGNYAGTSDGYLGVTKNPVAMQERTRNNKGLNFRVFGNVFAEVDVAKDFLLRTSFGGQVANGYAHSFVYPAYEGTENLTSNSYAVNSFSNREWTWTNTVQYKKTFNSIHSLTVIAGTEANKIVNEAVNSSTQDYFSFDPNYTTLNTGTGTRLNSSSRAIFALSSYLGRVEYGFKDKYLLNGTMRRDGSSRFLNNQFGWFPSVSAAWRLSQESFFDKLSIDWISDLKIRAAYGVMGNQINVDPSNAFTTYGSDMNLSSYDINGTSNSLVTGFMKSRIGNPDAKWERDINSNLGIDATLWGGTLSFSIDYYQKKIKDLLFNPELIGAAGQAQSPFVNIAQMKNDGIDASATTVINISKDMQFSAGLTFTSYNNRILSVSNNANYFDQDSRRFNGSSIVRNQVGHPVGSFFGYQIAGFWNSQEEIDKANEGAKNGGDPNAVYQDDIGIGRFRYKDTNGDGKVTPDDRVFLGNPNPDFSYGLNIGFTYRNFDFGMFLYGVYGNDIWNNVLWWTDFYSSFNESKSHTALYNSWTSDHHNAKAPIQEFTGSFSTANVPNSYFVEKGSYLRAKNTQIGYTFSDGVSERIGIDNLRVYIQAANLFTITKYSGLDPEVAGSTTDFGVDEGAYPSQRQFLIGVNVTF